MPRQKSEEQDTVGVFAYSRIDLTFLAFILIFAYLQLFILPISPLYAENDQLLPISNAIRLLDGEVMYRDFFHFAPPGTELYYAAIFSIFGVKVWVANLTIFLLAAAQLFILFTLSKRILPPAFTYLPTLIYFIIGFRQFGIDGSYRLFSVVFVLSAALLFMFKRGTKALFAAAVLCGISSFFVQTRGLLGIAAIGLFLLWEQWSNGLQTRTLLRDWAMLGSTFFTVVILTQFYMAWLGGFENYFFGNFIFLKDHYGADTLSNTLAYFTDIPDIDSYMVTYGTASGLFRFVRVAGPTFFYYALVPMVYVVYFVYRRVRGAGKSDQELVFLSILGTILFLGVSAPTAFRLYHVSIPAVVVLVWLISKHRAHRFVATYATIALLILGVLYSVQRQTIERTILELPAGDAAFLSDRTAEKYVWLGGEVKPGEFFYEAQHATFYFALHLRNPTPFYLIRDNNYTPDFQVDQLLTALRANPPRLIAWHGEWSKEPQERIPGDNLAPLWDFIRSNYRLKKEFLEYGEFTVNGRRDIEFWERKDTIDPPTEMDPSQIHN